MKESFVSTLILILREMPGALGKAFVRESMHYKDLRMAGHDPRKVYRGFKNLTGRGIMQPASKGGFKFTRAGQAWYRRSLLKYHRLRRTEWDGKWRVLLFDIPSELNNERNKFRQRLRTLGFHILQKSVFVFPFSCEEEIGEICERFKIGDYVNIILADTLGSAEEEIKNTFGL